MLRLSEPHGGTLVDRFVTEEEAEQLQEDAARLPQITLDEREALALELIATGAASPLTGFLGHRDYQSVLARLRLANGTPWPLPITLAVSLPQLAAALRQGAAALRGTSGRLAGILRVSDAFVRSPREEAVALHGTEDPDHPGVRYLLSRPTGVLGGAVAVVRWRAGEGRPATPREIRAIARRRGWTDLVGLATTEGLACVEGSGEREGSLLGAQSIPSWHAPGRDALLQAIVLKNLGAREAFLEHERSDWTAAVARLGGEELGITPVLVGARAPTVALALHPATAA